jgi:hypothetical protein
MGNKLPCLHVECLPCWAAQPVGVGSVTDLFVWKHTMDHPDDLRRRAGQYRDIARTATGAATVKALYELADRYEALATEAQARRDLDRQDQC